MTIDEKYNQVLERLSREIPMPETELHYTNGYQLLTAVILSAQCTDKRINMVTPALFAAYPTAKDLAAADTAEIYEYIKSVSYPNNKAKALSGMAKALTQRFGGNVPDNMGDLLDIPGVGRKTANVILAVLYGQAGGYPCLPRKQPYRADRQLTYPNRNRAHTHAAYPGTPCAESPPLAHITWSIRMQGSTPGL